MVGPRPLRVLDLFAGIGGMHYALGAAGFTKLDVTAVDIDGEALQVLKHNLPETTCIAKDITSLDTDWFRQEGRFDAWTLTPPCQPYTRQPSALQLDHADCRSAGLHHVCQLLLSSLPSSLLPSFIILENVTAFATSNSFDELKTALQSRSYSFFATCMSPRHIGFPNERSRFYLVAISADKAADEFFGSLLSRAVRSPDYSAVLEVTCNTAAAGSEEALRLFMEEVVGSVFFLTDGQVRSAAAQCLDVVSEYYCRLACKADLPPAAVDFPPPPFKLHTACFTRNYARYFRGTGSVWLAAEKSQSENNPFDITKVAGRLRWFTPDEAARLMGFPLHSHGSPQKGGDYCLFESPFSFEFPVSLSLRKKYRLIGNSLNPQVVAFILRLTGFSEIFTHGKPP